MERPAKDDVQTQSRQRPAKVKEQIVRAREFKNLRLESEPVVGFAYRPTLGGRTYRVVVVRKNLSVAKGEQVLFDDVGYFFYLTNDRTTAASEGVFLANDRCNQENLIEQLKNSVRALPMPVDNRVSNWAYLVMASLAWSLKACFGLLLPERGRWKERYRQEKRSVLKMKFKRFVNAFVRVPGQVVRTGRRLAYRFDAAPARVSVAWNPWPAVFLRGVDALRCPLRC